VEAGYRKLGYQLSAFAEKTPRLREDRLCVFFPEFTRRRRGFTAGFILLPLPVIANLLEP
jgi:hypothetical protein